MKKISTLFYVLFVFNGLGQNLTTENKMYCESKNYYANKAYGQGTNELEFKRYKNAVGYLEYAVKLDTAFCDAWNNLGVAHRLLGNWDKSYWSFVHAAYWDSVYHYPWLNLSEWFLLKGDTGNSIRSIRNLLKYSPANVYGLEGMGKLYYKLGLYDSSTKYIDWALKLRPETDSRLYKAYLLFETKKFDDFKRVANSIYYLYKKDPLLNYYYAKYFEMLNEKEKSGKYYKKALKYNSK